VIVVVVESIPEFVVGVGLVLIAVPLLWFYERQRTRVECLISFARSEFVSVPGPKVSASNRGYLVHLAGEEARCEANIRDPRFAFPNQVQCLRLRTIVQAFQWVEHMPKGALDGKAPTASYEQRWCDAEQGSHLFQDREKHNPIPQGLHIGTTTTNCSRVELGTGFIIPQGLVDQCRSFRPLGPSGMLGEEVTTLDGKYTFKRHTDGNYYYRDGPKGWTSKDVASKSEVGDVCVRFEAIPPGPITVLALQVDAEGGEYQSFLPYRLVPHGLFGLEDEERREALIKEAKKSREQLAREDQCLPGSRICCGCNLVAGCCTGVLTQEVFSCFEGSKSADHCFKEVLRQAFGDNGCCRACFLRIFGGMVVFVGLLMAFSQMMVNLGSDDFIPVVGMFGNFARPGICLMITLWFASLVVALAYLPYRPIKAILYLLVSLAILVVPNVIAYALTSADIVQPMPAPGFSRNEKMPGFFWAK
jgi:hypothetical protein